MIGSTLARRHGRETIADRAALAERWGHYREKRSSASRGGRGRAEAQESAEARGILDSPARPSSRRRGAVKSEGDGRDAGIARDRERCWVFSAGAIGSAGAGTHVLGAEPDSVEPL